MKRARVALANKAGHVDIDPRATEGAIFGVNLRNADGSLVTAEQFAAAGVTLEGIPTTDALTEGAANLYFTNARADARIAVHVALPDPHTQYQPNLLFQEDGVDEGTVGAINTVNFTGAGVDVSESGGEITVDIPGASSPGGSYTPPDAADFAWINQGGASLDNTDSQLGILAPATAGASWRILEQAIPGAYPWTLTACLAIGATLAENYAGVAIGVKDAGSNKLVLFQLQWDTNVPKLAVSTYSNPTTGVANLFINVASAYFPIWLRIVADATNFTYYVSANKQQWRQVYQAARTGYLTAPAAVFFGVNASPTFDNGASLLSWDLV